MPLNVASSSYAVRTDNEPSSTARDAESALQRLRGLVDSVPSGEKVDEQDLDSALPSLADDGKVDDSELTFVKDTIEKRPQVLTGIGHAKLSALLEVKRSLGDQAAVDALKQGVLKYREAEAQKRIGALSDGTVVSAYSDVDVPRGLDLSSLGTLGLGPEGRAFLVGGGGKITGATVKIQPVVHDDFGNGHKLWFQVGRRAGDEIEARLANHPNARILLKAVIDAPPEGNRVRLRERNLQSPTREAFMNLGYVLRVVHDRSFWVDYFPEELALQTLRGRVEVHAFGGDEGEQQKNLEKAFEFLGLTDDVLSKPTPEQERIEAKMRLLWQASPQLWFELRDAYENQSLEEVRLDEALRAARVPPQFAREARFVRVSESEIDVAVASQGEAYARAGVVGLVHAVRNPADFAKVVAGGGLLATLDRTERSIVHHGMSSDMDLTTGGGGYVFARVATRPLSPRTSGGVIEIDREVLDRTGFFGYSADRYGSTTAPDRGEPSAALLAVAKRSLEASPELRRSFIGYAAGDIPAVSEDQAASFLKRLISRHQADTFKTRSVGRALIQTIANAQKNEFLDSNETMIRGHIPVTFMRAYVVGTQSAHGDVVRRLKEAGIDKINGIPVESFVRVDTKIFNTQPTSAAPAGSSAAPAATPAAPVGSSSTPTPSTNADLSFYLEPPNSSGNASVRDRPARPSVALSPFEVAHGLQPAAPS